MPHLPSDMTARERIAAFLLDRDERPGDSMEWAQNFIRTSKDEAHCGDCTKVPMTCSRCVVDAALADADAILALVK